METTMMGYMGGCQNYGPFWIPILIRPLIFRVPQKGTIILITTHMETGVAERLVGLGFRVSGFRV